MKIERRWICEQDGTWPGIEEITVEKETRYAIWYDRHFFGWRDTKKDAYAFASECRDDILTEKRSKSPGKRAKHKPGYICHVPDLGLVFNTMSELADYTGKSWSYLYSHIVYGKGGKEVIFPDGKKREVILL